MIISDLTYLEIVAESSVLGGSDTEVDVEIKTKNKSKVKNASRVNVNTTNQLAAAALFGSAGNANVTTQSNDDIS